MNQDTERAPHLLSWLKTHGLKLGVVIGVALFAFGGLAVHYMLFRDFNRCFSALDSRVEREIDSSENSEDADEARWRLMVSQYAERSLEPFEVQDAAERLQAADILNPPSDLRMLYCRMQAEDPMRMFDPQRARVRGWDQTLLAAFNWGRLGWVAEERANSCLLGATLDPAHRVAAEALYQDYGPALLAEAFVFRRRFRRARSRRNHERFIVGESMQADWTDCTGERSFRDGGYSRTATLCHFRGGEVLWVTYRDAANVREDYEWEREGDPLGPPGPLAERYFDDYLDRELERLSEGGEDLVRRNEPLGCEVTPNAPDSELEQIHLRCVSGEWQRDIPPGVRTAPEEEPPPITLEPNGEISIVPVSARGGRSIDSIIGSIHDHRDTFRSCAVPSAEVRVRLRALFRADGGVSAAAAEPEENSARAFDDCLQQAAMGLRGPPDPAGGVTLVELVVRWNALEPG